MTLDDLRLSPRQETILKTLRIASPGERTIDELIVRICEREKIAKKNAPTRRSVNGSIVQLQAKLADTGWRLEKISGVGAGKIGRYRLKRKRKGK